MVRKRRKCFYARKIIKKRVVVSFRTSEGRKISFKATKAVRSKRRKRVC